MYDISYLSQPLRNLFERLLRRFLVGSDGMSSQKPEQSLEDHRFANMQLAEVLCRIGVLEHADLDTAFSIHGSSLSLADTLRSAAGLRQLLGSLLLKNGRITYAQLDHALNEQKRTGERLGDLLIRHGFIEEKELDAALATQNNLKKSPAPTAFNLGNILIASGQITRKQLNDTLEQQKFSGKKIGELLVGRGYAQQSQIDQGLRLQHILVSAALGTAMALCPLVKAEAGSSGAGLNVTASVKKISRLKVLHQEAQMVITSENIAQGYLEITAASRVEVRNSSLSGYMLTFAVPEGAFRHVLVSGLGTELQINFGSGWVLMPHSHTPDVLELTYRFILTDDIKPGAYPWPVQISSMAI
ncbi:MAG: hypothetical protein ACYDG4_01425 [Desulfuromonadaceae bacterium]